MIIKPSVCVCICVCVSVTLMASEARYAPPSMLGSGKQPVITERAGDV